MESKEDRLIKQMKFIEEIDKEKLIGRQTYLSDASRKENDAEHAWHMAIMAYLLQEYSNASYTRYCRNRCRRYLCI